MNNHGTNGFPKMRLIIAKRIIDPHAGWEDCHQ